MMKQNKKIFILTLFFLIGFVCIAQGPPPPQPPPTGPVGLPIDGGVLMAAFFALIYGVKKLAKSN